MAEQPDITQEPYKAEHVEKKCEREFRKLLEETELNVEKGKNMSKEVSLEKGKKRLKADEENTSNSENSSCDRKEQNSTKLGTVSVSSDQVPLKTNVNLQTESNLETLFTDLKQQSCSEAMCLNVINLAIHCSNNASDVTLSTVFKSLDLLKNPHKSEAFAISHALLLLTLTTKKLNLEQIICLEVAITKLADYNVLDESRMGNKRFRSRLTVLRGDHYLKSFKLCQKLLLEKNLDIDAFDVQSLCCTSLRNLSTCETGLKYQYNDRTLKFILGMTGKATQEIVSENLIENEDSCATVSMPSHMVNQCLKILEHMLIIDPDSPYKTDHEDFSLLHCLTRLLGWCISHLFQRGQPEEQLLNIRKSPFSSFHLSTLISILKILSVLSFNPDQCDSFTNTRGLMEKVMICILRTYFQSEENCFEILVLALEVMINFFMKNKKTFVLLCLKKFQINDSEQILSIEALAKILENSLDKINELKTKPLTVQPEVQQNEGENRNSVEDNVNLVLEAADEDMELSTIVSFISILLVFFMDTKTSFVDFIRERLSLEKSNEAIVVSKKFLQFASLTGGMPITGILLLRHAIKKLSRLYQRNGVSATET